MGIPRVSPGPPAKLASVVRLVWFWVWGHTCNDHFASCGYTTSLSEFSMTRDTSVLHLRISMNHVAELLLDITYANDSQN